MLHGKKGFERIVWAFKNVLNHSLTWLFHDVQNPEQPPSGTCFQTELSFCRASID